jgi:hypothetical protein
MKLLVACSTGVFTLDALTGDVAAIAKPGHGPYGISWTYDGRQLALSDCGPQPSRLESLESYLDSERGKITLGGRAGPPCLSAPHQILCTERHVVATNTGRNCLTVFNQSDLFYQNRWLDGVRWDRKGPDDCCGSHFNSLYLRGDCLYVLAHNYQKGSYVLVLSWPELVPLDRIPTRARGAHNVWPQPGGEIVLCDTMAGGLAEVWSGRTLWRSPDDTALTRGLACAGGLVFVGKAVRTTPEERARTDGGVWVLDRATWREIDFLPLPRAGQVREVRVLDAADECHHGRPLLDLPAADPQATRAYRDRLAAAGTRRWLRRSA